MKLSTGLGVYYALFVGFLTCVSACTGSGYGYNQYYTSVALGQACEGAYQSGFGYSLWKLYSMDVEARKSPEDTNQKVWHAMLNCTKSAKNCDEYLACTMASEDQIAKACVHGGGGCADGVAVDCTNEVKTKWNCAAAGLQCFGNNDYHAVCGGSACEIPYKITCNGNYLHFCVEGVQVTDCSLHMSICTSKNGYAGCDEPSKIEILCDGKALVMKLDDTERRYDCTETNPANVCRVVGYGAVCGLAVPECDVNDYIEQCSNGVITFCIDDRVTTFDCKSVGLSGCKKYNPSDKGATCVK